MAEEKALKFEELRVGDKVRYGYATAATASEDEVRDGTGTVHQITPNLVVIHNGKYRFCATRVEMLLGRFKAWRVA